jgi:hypothetical protein
MSTTINETPSQRLLRACYAAVNAGQSDRMEIAKIMNTTLIGLNHVQEGIRPIPDSTMNRLVEKFNINPLWIYGHDEADMFCKAVEADHQDMEEI